MINVREKVTAFRAGGSQRIEAQMLWGWPR